MDIVVTSTSDPVCTIASEPMNMRAKLNRLLELDGRAESKLAKDLEIPTSTMNNIFKGNNDPGFSKMAAIARAFDASLDWLADDTVGFPKVPMNADLSAESIMEPKTRELFQKMIAYSKDDRAAVVAAGIEALSEMKEDDRRRLIGKVYLSRGQTEVVAPKPVTPVRDSASEKYSRRARSPRPRRARE